MIKIEPNVAYWCPTKESAEKFMEHCRQQGITWNNNTDCNKNNTRWNINNKNTCYLNGNVFNKKIQFGTYSLYKEYNYKIVDFSKLLNKENKEEKMKFKVGDRVIVKSNHYNEYGKTGTIIEVNRYDCLIEFDKNICKTHNIFGCFTNQNKRYAFIEFEKLEFVKPKTITIKTDGKTTTAYMGKKQGKAVCGDSDEFDLKTGAKLAIDRLFEEEFKPYLDNNGEKAGYIGKKADFNSLFGEELFVGDMVNVYIKGIEGFFDDCFVCYDKEKGYFIMGLSNIRFINGISDDKQIKIKKTKSYINIKNGETSYGVKAVLSKC